MWRADPLPTFLVRRMLMSIRFVCRRLEAKWAKLAGVLRCKWPPRQLRGYTYRVFKVVKRHLKAWQWQRRFVKVYTRFACQDESESGVFSRWGVSFSTRHSGVAFVILEKDADLSCHSLVFIARLFCRLPLLHFQPLNEKCPLEARNKTVVCVDCCLIMLASDLSGSVRRYWQTLSPQVPETRTDVNTLILAAAAWLWSKPIVRSTV